MALKLQEMMHGQGYWTPTGHLNCKTPGLLLLLHAMKILLLLLTHSSNYHLLRFVFMFYMGDIMCTLISG